MQSKQANKENTNKIQKIQFTKIFIKLSLFVLYTIISTAIITYLMIYILKANSSLSHMPGFYITALIRQTPIIFASIVITGLIITIFSIIKLKAYKYSRRSCLSVFFEVGSSFFLYLLSLITIITAPAIITLMYSSIESTRYVDKINQLISKEADYSTEGINEYLQQDSCPSIILEKEDMVEELANIALTDQDNKLLFNAVFLSENMKYELDYQIEFPRDEAQIFILEDKLYFLEVDSDKLETIDNELAYSIFKCEFPDREIDPNVKITYYNEDDFHEMRKKATEEWLEEIDEIIAAYESIMDEITKAKEEALYYYEIDPSPSWKIQWKEIADGYDEMYKDLETELEDMKIYRELIANSLDQNDSIIGHYDPGNEIAIVLDNGVNDFTRGYLTTLIHEYNHYVSDNDDHLSLTINEALTQMYTERMFSHVSTSDPVQSYEIETKLLRKVLKDTTSDQIEMGYFTQDEELIKSELNKEYGDDFYDDFIVRYNGLYYIDYYSQEELADEIIEEFDL